jgi:hypothetical protein
MRRARGVATSGRSWQLAFDFDLLLLESSVLFATLCSLLVKLGAGFRSPACLALQLAHCNAVNVQLAAIGSLLVPVAPVLHYWERLTVVKSID